MNDNQYVHSDTCDQCYFFISLLLQGTITLSTVFIDTFFEPTNQVEGDAFLKYSTQLWNFSSNAQPFECKDIKIALTELMEAEKDIQAS